MREVKLMVPDCFTMADIHSMLETHFRDYTFDYGESRANAELEVENIDLKDEIFYIKVAGFIE